MTITTGPQLLGEFLLILAFAAGVGAVFAMVPPITYPIGRRLGTTLLVVSVVLGALFLGSLAILRHASFHSNAFDLASLTQVVWNTSQGRLLASSLIPGAASLLGNHVSPILLLITPLYRLWPDPFLLLALQTGALVAGAWPLYRTAQRLLGAGRALLLVWSYLLSAPLLFLNLADFHEIVLSVPFLAFAATFLLERRYRAMVIALALALATREELGLIVAAFGLLLLLRQPRLLGVALLLGGAAWTGLAVGVIVPSFHEAGQNIYLDRYGYLGETPPQMVLTLLTKPLWVLGHLATWERAEFLLRLLVPLGLLPLLAPGFLLLSLPTLGYLLLSDYSPQFDITSQYHAPLIPLLFLGTIVAMDQGRAYLARQGAPQAGAALVRGAASAVLIATLLSYYLHGPGPLARAFEPSAYALSDRTTSGHRLLRQIPSEAGVAAQNNLAPHLTNRETLYLFPWVEDWERVTYIALDRQGNTYPFATDEDYEKAVGELLADTAWKVVADQDGFLILQRREGLLRKYRSQAVP